MDIAVENKTTTATIASFNVLVFKFKQNKNRNKSNKKIHKRFKKKKKKIYIFKANYKKNVKLIKRIVENAIIERTLVGSTRAVI